MLGVFLFLFFFNSSQYPHKVKKNRCEGIKCENAGHGGLYRPWRKISNFILRELEGP